MSYLTPPELSIFNIDRFHDTLQLSQPDRRGRILRSSAHHWRQFLVHAAAMAISHALVRGP
jgi:hypothetical protein